MKPRGSKIAASLAHKSSPHTRTIFASNHLARVVPIKYSTINFNSYGFVESAFSNAVLQYAGALLPKKIQSTNLNIPLNDFFYEDNRLGGHCYLSVSKNVIRFRSQQELMPSSLPNEIGLFMS